MRLAPPERLAVRHAGLRAAMAAHHLGALLVTSLPNIAYLTGFFASAGALVVTSDRLRLYGDARYDMALSACAEAVPSLEAVRLAPGEAFETALARDLVAGGPAAIGIEATHLTVRRHQILTAALSDAGRGEALVSTDGLVETLRLVKDDWEVDRLRDGAARLSEVAKCILPKALAGRTEAEIAADIDRELRRAGFERPAFDTIVASGPLAALPHARASGRRLEPGDLVVIDFGGVLDGYCTDLTRTIVVGPAGERERRLIAQVGEAQAAAFAALAPGRPPEAADQAARDALARHALADAFTHGTGHGLGLEVHESPRVSRVRSNQAEPLLAAGVVVTLEPGVYIPGWGGARIEDDVLVTEDGAEWLTDVPRTL